MDRPEADLTKTVGIFEGMTQDRVAEVMGMYPLNVELSDGITEWHYCATGISSRREGPAPDNFVAVYFADSKVIAMSNYQVTEADTDYTYGHCSMFVKRGNYHEPQIVVDMRVRHSYNRRRY